VFNKLKIRPRKQLRVLATRRNQPRSEVCLVAAHTSDLAAARDCGLKTVFVRRPLEYGPNRAGPPQPSQDWELSVDDLVELAAALGL
jgi:2-haloacid dehalogenase